MGKLKELFFKINAKAPVLKMLFWMSLLGIGWVGISVYEQFGVQPDLLRLYGVEDASVVRQRVEEQLRRLKPKPPPPPAPPAQMSYDVRILRQHNPFLPPGMVEQTATDVENKFTDVTGIDLIGTVYSYTPSRRSALIEMNGVAIVAMEGRTIRGTQKRVVEIGRARIVVQEEGLMPSPIYLPHEYGLDNLTSALSTNQYKSQSNWDYSGRYGKGRKKDKKESGAEEEAAAAGEGDEGGGKAGGEKKTEVKKKAAADEESADENSGDGDEETTDEDQSSSSSSGDEKAPAGGVDVGGGE